MALKYEEKERLSELERRLLQLAWYGDNSPSHFYRGSPDFKGDNVLSKYAEKDVYESLGHLIRGGLLSEEKDGRIVPTKFFYKEFRRGDSL